MNINRKIQESEKLKILFESCICKNEQVVTNLLKAVSEVIPCKLCSIWKINNIAKSVSIEGRVNYEPSNNLPYEYCHKLEGSLIGYSLNEIRLKKQVYLDIPDVSKEPYRSIHLSIDRVKKMKLKRLISIPIPNFEKWIEHPHEMDAILNIYPEDNINISESIIQLIRDQFSLTLSRSRLLQREDLTRKIIDVYKYKYSKDLSSVLHRIITQILPNFVRYEGCSIFIWDPFFNRLNLSQTTGLENKPRKSDVYYYLGEGLTGTIAKLKKSKFINDLININDPELKGEFLHKYREETRHPGLSFVAIPIMSPSRPEELVGVIRFTNKLCHMSDVVDFFSEHDIDIIEDACNLIALYMEYEQSQRVRASFAMQMAHEMFTPAFSIRGTCSRLIKKRKISNFSEAKIDSYLNDIQDQSELQIALTKSIEYLWKGTTNVPKKYRYNISRINFYEDVVYPSKKLVIPVARMEGITFDNIVISGDYPFLYCDKYAFRQVFFNLLTNAIKYRLQNADLFKVKIDCIGYGKYPLPDTLLKTEYTDLKKKIIEGFLIKVEDYGIGINQEEIDKIFLLGYRTKGLEKQRVRGLGMGLTVVKSILNDFGCYIWINKNRNPTSFVIVLPYALSSDDYLNIPSWAN